VIHYYWDGSKWNTEDLGGRIDGRPTISADKSRMDVFARVGNQLWHRAWAGFRNAWDVWENLGLTIDSDPVAVSTGQGRIDVFYRASNGETHRYVWDGFSRGHRYTTRIANDGWVTAPSLGGFAKDIPAVASMDGTQAAVVFVQGGDDGIYQRDLRDGNLAGPWSRVPGCTLGVPGATFHEGRIDLVVRSNSDGRIYHNFTSDWPSTAAGALPVCCGSLHGPSCVPDGHCGPGMARQPNTGKCERCGGQYELCCTGSVCDVGVCAGSPYSVQWCANRCGGLGEPVCATGSACSDITKTTYDAATATCLGCGHLNERGCMDATQHCFDPNTTYDSGSGLCVACGHQSQRGCIGNGATCTDASNVYDSSVGECVHCGELGEWSCSGVCYHGNWIQNNHCVPPPPPPPPPACTLQASDYTPCCFGHCAGARFCNSSNKCQPNFGGGGGSSNAGVIVQCGIGNCPANTHVAQFVSDSAGCGGSGGYKNQTWCAPNSASFTVCDSVCPPGYHAGNHAYDAGCDTMVASADHTPNSVYCAQ
jgi:hypothetical protein